MRTRTSAVGVLVLVNLWVGSGWAQPAANDVPPPAPPAPSLDSPRDTLTSFLDAMTRVNAGDDQAMSLVEACFASPLATRVDLRGTAQQIFDIADRLGGFDLASVPGTAPNVSTGRGESITATRFVVFPRDSHAWVWEKLGHAPEGKIVLVADAGGQWRFDHATVMGADKLYQSLKDLPPRGLSAAMTTAEETPVIDTLGETFHKTAWWGWTALLAAIFLSLLGGKLTQSGLRAFADHFKAQGAKARAIAVESVLGPLSLALLATGLLVGLRFIHLNEPVGLFAHRVLAFLYLIAIGWTLYNLVEVLEVVIRNMVGHADSRLGDMLVPLVRKTLRVFLVVVFSLVVAQNVFGLNITGWLAGLGIAGLAISLAAQDSVKNLFGSLTVLLDKPFVVGDRIIFQGVDGTVEEIGFRSTRIRTLTGHVVTVPNMKFTDNQVENVNMRKNIRRTLDVGLTYDTPPDKVDQAVRIIRDLLAEPEFAEPFDMEKTPPRVFFNEYNATSLNIRVMYWYTLADGRDWWSYNAYCERFNQRLLRAFREADIEFAFPTQTVYLAGDSKRPVQAIAPGQA